MRIGRGLAESPAGVEAVKRLSAEDRGALFEAWVQDSASWPPSAPAVMTTADPGFYLGRAWRTWLCGSEEQKLRAMAFLEFSRCPEAVDLLQRACEQAKSRHADSLETAARLALARCHQGREPKGTQHQ